MKLINYEEIGLIVHVKNLQEKVETLHDEKEFCLSHVLLFLVIVEE